MGDWFWSVIWLETHCFDIRHCCTVRCHGYHIHGYIMEICSYICWWGLPACPTLMTSDQAKPPIHLVRPSPVQPARFKLVIGRCANMRIADVCLLFLSAITRVKNWTHCVISTPGSHRCRMVISFLTSVALRRWHLPVGFCVSWMCESLYALMLSLARGASSLSAKTPAMTLSRLSPGLQSGSTRPDSRLCVRRVTPPQQRRFFWEKALWSDGASVFHDREPHQGNNITFHGMASFKAVPTIHTVTPPSSSLLRGIEGAVALLWEILHASLQEDVLRVMAAH